MRIGTFLCWLWGHKFHGEKLEYTPHYLDLVKRGLATTCMKGDYVSIGFQSSYCVRCGISSPTSQEIK